tara:strand:+ start:9952 stop:11034 length:1083 start_codon:yes stop_codon:yes gene_type:complete
MYLDYFPAGFMTSFLLCLGLIYLDRKAAASGDLNLRPTPQTLHEKSISRFGGVAVILSMSLVLIMAGYGWSNSLYYQVGIITLPAFFVGFLDDLKVNIKPMVRLIFLLPVPIMYFYYFDLKVLNLDIGVLDNFLEFEALALLFLCFAIIGMTNAFNLIDGINGQLISYLISILFALNIVEYTSGNPVFQISDEFRLFANLLLGALLGFFVLNFPFGKIFMGDAGAYFLGAIVCWGLIYAHLENGNSPWAVMCVLAYPFTDLVFSVFRRRFITGGDAMQPDAEHLHHVIYERLKKLKFRHERARHFFTVVFITLFNLPYLCATMFFVENTPALMAIFAAYIFSYLLIYFALSPRFLMSNEK